MLKYPLLLYNFCSQKVWEVLDTSRCWNTFTFLRCHSWAILHFHRSYRASFVSATGLHAQVSNHRVTCMLNRLFRKHMGTFLNKRKHSTTGNCSEKSKRTILPTWAKRQHFSPCLHNQLFESCTHLKKWAFVSVELVNGSQWNPYYGDKWDSPTHPFSPHWVLVLPIVSRSVLNNAGSQYALQRKKG